jgi:hypothetical protein
VRPDNAHPVSTPQLGVLPRHRVPARDLAEEGLHVPCWRERDQDAACVADGGPDVRHHAGSQGDVARPQEVADDQPQAPEGITRRGGTKPNTARVATTSQTITWTIETSDMSSWTA